MTPKRIADLRKKYANEWRRKDYILNEELPGNEMLDEIERLRSVVSKCRLYVWCFEEDHEAGCQLDSWEVMKEALEESDLE